MKCNITSLEYRQRQRNNSKYLKLLRKRATKAELIVKEWLEKNGIKFMFQKGFLNPFHRIVDFYIPVKGIIIEVDGNSHNERKELDKIKDREWLYKRAMRTIRITNEQVYNGSFKRLLIWK